MNLDNLQKHYDLLEERGFITNCPPRSDLKVYHDKVSQYCEHLNKLALSSGNYIDPPFGSVHLNEPAGDYIAIFKIDGTHEDDAMDVINAHANKMARQARGRRHW
ncbi:hypothetical protein [Methylocaldum sp.]|uniref:hypothetical protein n=1 Tax=Methylocaldum sp. TaxID=1969727 RepID=UPI002D43C524|nr:hypothetical protein [Methylocaldum sp.]HYE36669.1 hypothetical protein [Methylocaldum sp.]